MAKEFKHLNVSPELAEILKSLAESLKSDKEVHENEKEEESIIDTDVVEPTEDKQDDPFQSSEQEEATPIEIKKPDNMGCLCCYCCHFHTRKAQHTVD